MSNKDVEPTEAAWATMGEKSVRAGAAGPGRPIGRGGPIKYSGGGL